MAELDNIMMTPKKSTKIDSPHEFPDIFDISHIRNIDLFKKIIRNHPVDLYFLWRIGVKDIEKGKINSSFPDWNRNHVKIQVHTNLTRARIKNSTINLLKPFDRDYDPKLHDIESSKFRLSGLGKKVWNQAHRDGLWDIIKTIPLSYCLKFQKFEEYFRSHLFLTHSEYSKKISELVPLPSLEEKKAPKRKRKEERNNIDFYFPEEKTFIKNYLKKGSGFPYEFPFEAPKKTFSSNDILEKLRKYISDKCNEGISSRVEYKAFMHYYRNSLDRPRLGKTQNKRFLTALDKFMNKLDWEGYVDITSDVIQGKVIEYVSLARRNKSHSFDFYNDNVKISIADHINRITSSNSSLKARRFIFFVFGKAITALMWVALLSISIPIQEIWYQEVYYTPIPLLYTYFSKLKLFIIISSVKIHSFILSLKLKM